MNLLRTIPGLSFFLIFSLAILGQETASAQAPVNDNLANRIVLSGEMVFEDGTNVNATREANEFDHGFDGDGGAASIWYEWTAPSSGPFLLDTTGSADLADGGDLDTNVGIYTSASANPTHTDLALFVLNDDGYNDIDVGVPAEVIFLATQGTTYYIAIDTFSGDGGLTQPQGTVSLNISPEPSRPANDDLSEAETLSSALPASATGNNRAATREEDEPFHGNAPSFASLWYQWTALQSQPVKIDFSGTGFNIIGAVYEGDAYANLNLLEIGTGDTLRIDAVAGTTYSILADGNYAFFQPTGDINVEIRPNTDIALITFGSEWDYLHPTDGTNPAIADADFDSTWHLGGGIYDGPPFTAGTGLFGYGTINFGPIVTDIGQPAAGVRYSAYFRKEIEVNENASNVMVRALVDDGAAFYLDGEIVGRVNYSAAPDSYLQLSDAVGSEDDLVEFTFPDIPAGDHTIAVSLHNQAINSSDLGFDMELIYDPGGVIPTDDADGDGASDDEELIAGTDPNDSTDVFKVIESSITAAGEFSIEWSSVAGKAYTVEFATDPSTPTASWVFLDLVIGTGGTDSLNGALPIAAPSAGFMRVRVEE